MNEKGANARGAEVLGWTRATEPAPAAMLVVERGDNVPKALRDGTGRPGRLRDRRDDVPAAARVAFPLPTWAERDGLLVNVDGIVQQQTEARAGPARSGLRSLVDVLEELRVELDAGAEPLGREGAVEAIRALEAFRGVAFPSIATAPPPSKTVAAPATTAAGGGALTLLSSPRCPPRRPSGASC